MKTLFGTRTYIAIVGLGILGAIAAQAWGQAKAKPTRPPVSTATHVLIIGDYVASKSDQAAFEAALDGVSSAASMDLYSKDENGKCKHHKGPHNHQPAVCVRTDRTIVPESASNDSAKVTFIQARTTVQVASTSWADIKKVTDALQ